EREQRIERARGPEELRRDRGRGESGARFEERDLVPVREARTSRQARDARTDDDELHPASAPSLACAKLRSAIAIFRRRRTLSLGPNTSKRLSSSRSRSA